MASIFIILNLLFPNPTFASSEIRYQEYMAIWDENISLAKRYLQETEIALNQGDTLVACSSQRKASQYGILATKSRIKADKLKGFSDGIENLEIGLKKWEELGNSCS